MEHHRTWRASIAAAAAIAAAGAAMPAFASEGKPPEHAPAYGVREEAPPAHSESAAPEQAPPQHAAAEQPAPKRAAPKRATPKRTAPAGAKRSAKRTAPAGAKHTAPAPKRAAPAGAERGASQGRALGHDKVTICHATGSETSPYVPITIPQRAVDRAHDDHQDGGDLIPIPPECEAAAPAGAVAGAGESRDPATPGENAVDGPVTPSGVPAHGAKLTPPEGDGESLGIIQSEPPEGAATEVTPARATSGDGGLPFTGMQLALVALIGAGALLTGLALRRASRATA